MNKKVLYFHNKQKDYGIDETSDNYNELVSNAIEEEISEAIAEMSEYLDENISVVGHYYNVPLKLVGKIELPLDYNSNTPMEYFEYMYRTNDSSAMVNLGRIIDKSIEISDEVANEVMSVIDSYSKSEIDSKLKAIEEKLGEGSTNIPDSIVDDFREALNAKLDISQWQKEKEKFATKEQVQKIISEITIPELDTSNIDLSNYATNESVDTKMANKVSVVEFSATKALLEDNKLDKEVYERDKPTFALKTELNNKVNTTDFNSALALKRNIDDTYSKEEIDSRFNNASDNSEEINKIVQEKINEFVKSRKAKVVVFEDTISTSGVYFSLIYPNKREELYYLSIPANDISHFIYTRSNVQNIQHRNSINITKVELPLPSPLRIKNIWLRGAENAKQFLYIYQDSTLYFYFHRTRREPNTDKEIFAEITFLHPIATEVEKVILVDRYGNIIIKKLDGYYIRSCDKTTKILNFNGSSIPIGNFTKINFSNLPSKVIDIQSFYLNGQIVVLCENGDVYFCGDTDSFSKTCGNYGSSVFSLHKLPLTNIRKIIMLKTFFYEGSYDYTCLFISNDNILYRPCLTKEEKPDIVDATNSFRYKIQERNIKDILFFFSYKKGTTSPDYVVKTLTGELRYDSLVLPSSAKMIPILLTTFTFKEGEDLTYNKNVKEFSRGFLFYDGSSNVLAYGVSQIPLGFSYNKWLNNPPTRLKTSANGIYSVYRTSFKSLNNIYAIDMICLLQVEEPSEEEIRQGKNAKFTLYWRDTTYTLYV